jgi:hypothetical protein
MSCWSVSQRGALHRGRRNIGSSCRKLYRDTIYVDARDRKIRKQTLQDIFVKTNPLCIPSSWTYETKDTNSSAFATPRCPQLQKGAPWFTCAKGTAPSKPKACQKGQWTKWPGLARKIHRDPKDSASATVKNSHVNQNSRVSPASLGLKFTLQL